MAYVLQFPTFTQYDLLVSMADRDNIISTSRVFTWLLYGKIGESTTVQPRYTQVSVEPSAKNRYLTDVIVDPIPTITYGVTLAASATMTISNSAIGTVSTSNSSVATTSYSDGVVTITGVAAGTAVITVKDVSNDNMYIINVTVA